MNSVRRQTDGLNLHGRLSAFPISRMHTSNGTDNKRRQFRHKSRPQILPRLRQFGRAPPSGYIRGRFVHARILFSPLPSSFFFYFLFSLSFHFTLHTRALLPFLFLFLSLPPPPIDRRINPTWRAKQAESTLTWPVVFDGREEISVEFHSRHIGNPLLLPLPSPALGLSRLNWTFEWRGLLRSVFLVAAAPVFSGSLAKERYRGGYRYC